ncbi:MAG: hypothetical protein JWO97_2187 [Acidobacteria bacterium]|nr:hypothetical protein [Acidobacteriota bacterium]
MNNRFRNPRPLRLAGDEMADALETIDLNGIPVVDDFTVQLREVDDEHGSHVDFVSASHGLLTTFPAWDHAERDLRHFNPTDVPLGTLEQPYEDADDEWRIVIFAKHAYVYVFEADAPRAQSFPRFFRVTRDRYFEQWAQLLALFNPATELDA